jgi:hypothetical protein
MGLLRLSGFSGMWPIRDPRALPDNAAVLARNMMYEGGAYLKGARLPFACEDASPRRAHGVSHPTARGEHARQFVWMEFADENTAVFRGSLVNDQYERFYWASPSGMPEVRPQVHDIVWRSFQALSWGFPYACYVAPGLTTITGGTGPDETRSYLATFVNVYGEESQPRAVPWRAVTLMALEHDYSAASRWRLCSVQRLSASTARLRARRG